MKSSDYQLDYEHFQDSVETMERTDSEGAVMFTHSPLGSRAKTGSYNSPPPPIHTNTHLIYFSIEQITLILDHVDQF